MFKTFVHIILSCETLTVLKFLSACMHIYLKVKKDFMFKSFLFGHEFDNRSVVSNMS